ncbi:MAG: hypothetical protein F6K50_18980 [Moorea sp. SIO3I7]|uniref:hypothetical protein n=1 Tax=Moorena sp. SIO3I8 TaxID=2607833 RepID=UPI0013C1AD76|nr:hypothetical protein [Moorena sp. SIO3I8]NEN97532.1 hypothetical protein [Moorena sp. SIO3I7]NEO05583.1 hypothetical protein [Moorena sp. SIO3I8]
MPKELKVTMLGHRGVGKTSVLTAMYEQFSDTFKEADLQLTPDPESSALLQQRLGELKGLLDDFEATGGLEGDQNPQSFKFGLGKIGDKPSLQLTFQDFPGGYLDDKDGEFVKKIMHECVAVLIAIDAPALMEANGKWHHLMNRPKQICDIFSRSYGDLKEPRLVILVPVRCEKYLQNEEDATKLLHCIKDKYAELLRLFKSENLLTKIACVITPIQTVGTVIFNNIRVVNQRPRFYFRKISHDAGYSPKDSDQPLRYLLSFLLKLHYDTKWGWFNPIRHWLGWDKFLLKAAKKSADKCKSAHGFAIIQGKDKFYINK